MGQDRECPESILGPLLSRLLEIGEKEPAGAEASEASGRAVGTGSRGNGSAVAAN